MIMFVASCVAVTILAGFFVWLFAHGDRPDGWRYNWYDALVYGSLWIALTIVGIILLSTFFGMQAQRKQENCYLAARSNVTIPSDCGQNDLEPLKELVNYFAS